MSYYITYDSDGNQVEKTSINGQTKTITTGTDENGKSYVSNDCVTAKTTTDDFGRTTEVKTSCGEGNSVYFTQYEYADGKAENSTTNLVSKLTQKYGADALVNYEYTYDANGNITQVYENGELAHKYTYDCLNQLKEEYDYINRFYINYSYDKAGNIQSKNEQYLDPTYDYPSGSPTGNVYEYTDTEWKDKVTKINGDTITYDESGNPLSYRDGMTFEWKNGRQLSSLQIADNSVSYKYDSNGMRTQKTDNNGTTYYYYDSNNNLIGLTKGNDTLLFYYDSDGNVTSFKYNGIMYYYIKNLQGDVVKIINQSGTVYASYVYDAWGNIKSVSGEPILRELNPFRYRSYVYDTESGLYYLQSRYYDPFIGRFLNADVYCDTQSDSPLSTNMFAYCENNTVCRIDIYGNSWITIIKGIVISAAYTMRLSIMMYAYAATGARLNNNISLNNWWNPIGQALKSRLKSSKKISDRVKSYIKKTTSRNKTYSKTESIGFSYSSKTTADLDLAYSVGNASNCKIKVTRTNDIQWFTNKRKYIVTITLSDLYDFAYFGKKEQNFIKRCINDYFGYYPQKYGVLKKYNWKISFSYNYYK